MSLTISDALLQAAHMSEAELRQEIAVMLFQRDKLTLAQASQFAHMTSPPVPTYAGESSDSCAL